MSLVGLKLMSGQSSTGAASLASGTCATSHWRVARLISARAEEESEGANCQPSPGPLSLYWMDVFMCRKRLSFFHNCFWLVLVERVTGTGFLSQLYYPMFFITGPQR